MTKTELLLFITTIVSTIVPNIVSIINSYLSYNANIKTEKIKNFDKERIIALNDFIKKSHNYFSVLSEGQPSRESVAPFHFEMIHSFLALQLYFELDDATRERMFKMERMGSYDADWEFRNNLIVYLSKQINSYLK